MLGTLRFPRKGEADGFPTAAPLPIRSAQPTWLIIGAMMRKLIHVAFGVLKSGKNFDPVMHGC
jgi:hypothetical protein